MANNPAARVVSASVGDYLKAIFTLGGTEPASTKQLAEHLGVAPASVSGMLTRLDSSGLVSHQPYHGASLTADGRQQALRLVRRHRLIETWLVERMGYSWEEVHQEAEVLEHAVSDLFVQRLDVLLGHPTHDPHGDPIPSEAGRIPTTPDTMLADVPAGGRFRVSRIDTQEPDRLVALAGVDLVPGSEIEVVEAARSRKGPRVRSGERVHRLTLEVAVIVHGEVLGG